MGRILISEEEKNRILGMHQKATKKHYLGEQTTNTTGFTTNGITYRLPKITSNEVLDKFVNFGDSLYSQLLTLKNLKLDFVQQPVINPTNDAYLKKLQTQLNIMGNPDDKKLYDAAMAVSNDFTQGLDAVAQTGLTDVNKNQAAILNIIKNQNVNPSEYTNYFPVLQAIVNTQLTKV